MTLDSDIQVAVAPDVERTGLTAGKCSVAEIVSASRLMCLLWSCIEGMIAESDRTWGSLAGWAGSAGSSMVIHVVDWGRFVDERKAMRLAGAVLWVKIDLVKRHFLMGLVKWGQSGKDGYSNGLSMCSTEMPGRWLWHTQEGFGTWKAVQKK